MLLDTPGLDDTERFCVQLTERAVEDVDAVLFLTKSGAAYGQSEKDFLLSLLRRGTVKQLIFVVTQVDQTYEQHVKQRQIFSYFRGNETLVKPSTSIGPASKPT